MSLSKALYEERMENIQARWIRPVMVTREAFIKEFLQHFGKDAQCYPIEHVDEKVVERAISDYHDTWKVKDRSMFDLTSDIKHIRDIIVESGYIHKDLPDYDERSWDECGAIGCGARLPYPK
jgi:hypothetical protein